MKRGGGRLSFLGTLTLLASVLLITPQATQAAMWAPGATLEPGCAPTDSNCGVTTNIAIGTLGQVPYYAAAGNLLAATSTMTILSNGNLTATGSLSAALFKGLGSGLYGVPVLSSTAVHSFGDSITTGNGASPSSNAYAPLIASDMGATLTNDAISGSQACDMADLQIFPNENPTTPRSLVYTMLIGTNDANVKGAGSYETVFNLCHQASIAWLTIPSSSKVFGQSSSAVTTGTWINDNTYQTGISLQSTTNGSTLALPITTTGGPVYAWYRIFDGNGGTFTYAIDGGSATNVNAFTSPAIAAHNGSTRSIALIRIPNVASGSHTVTFTVTSATSGSNIVSLLGVGTPSNLTQYNPPSLYVGGVIRQSGDTKASDTAAYDSDIQANVSLLAGDGLPVHFVNVRSYVNSSTDMNDSVHPNNSGHSHLRDAFEAVMQFIPSSVFSGTLSNTSNLEVVPSGSVGGFFSAAGNTAYVNVNRNPTTGVFTNAGQTAVQTTYVATANGTSSYIQYFTNSAANVLTGTNEVMRLARGLSLGNSFVTTDPGLGNMIISGVLGIATSSPGSSLTVSGTANITGKTTFGTVNDTSLVMGNNGSVNYIQSITANNTTGYPLSFYQGPSPVATFDASGNFSTTRNVSVGTTTSLGMLSIAGTSADLLSMYANNGTQLQINAYNNTDFRIIQRSSAPMSFYTNATERMRITGGGFVGIGTTTPSTQLVVYTGASGGTPYGSASMTLETGGRSMFQFLSPNTTDSQGFYFGNNVSNTIAQLVYNPSAGSFGYAYGGQYKFFINASGNLGIGTTTPYSRLTIWGPDALAGTAAFTISNSASTTEFQVFDNGTATLAGTLTQNSDQRLKREITPLDASSTLAAITGLTPVSFIWRDLSQGSITQLGFIAQDVQQIFPSLVSTTSATTLTPDGTLGLNYIGLIAPIVEAIKELAGQVGGFAQSITTAVLNATTGNFTNINGHQICLDGTCITGSQLKTLLQNNGQQGSTPPAAGGGGAGSGTPVITATSTITVAQSANGTISPDTQFDIASGTNVSFTITPAAGYDIDTLLIDGQSIATSTSYVFTNVTADHTITATFTSPIIITDVP